MNGLTIIFALTAILAVFATISSLKNKNPLGIVFALGTAGVIGWFTVMTIINHGYPAAY